MLGFVSDTHNKQIFEKQRFTGVFWVDLQEGNCVLIYEKKHSTMNELNKVWKKNMSRYLRVRNCKYERVLYRHAQD